jgi:hypothetical protein
VGKREGREVNAVSKQTATPYFWSSFHEEHHSVLVDEGLQSALMGTPGQQSRERRNILVIQRLNLW